MMIFYNGDITDDDDIYMKYDNRAFMYGDGLFETMIWQNQQIRFEQYHKERLTAGMKAMGLVLKQGLDLSSIFSSIQELIKKSGYESARIRLHVWRSSGGLYTPQTYDSNVLTTCMPYESNSHIPKRKVGFSNNIRLNETPWSAYKTISAISYVQAGIERVNRDLDELILLDSQGHLSECTSSNIFWKQGDTYYTPSLKTGCIDGIMRRHIINQLQKTNIELRVGEYPKESLLRADEVFSCNVSGIYTITSIGETSYTENISITPLLGL